MENTSHIAEIERLAEVAQAAVDALRSAGASDPELREAEQHAKQAKRRLMYARVGALAPSEFLNDTGAPPGSHDKKK